MEILSVQTCDCHFLPEESLDPQFTVFSASCEQDGTKRDGPTVRISNWVLQYCLSAFLLPSLLSLILIVVQALVVVRRVTVSLLEVTHIINIFNKCIEKH
jgi:hypothetical protein